MRNRWVMLLAAAGALGLAACTVEQTEEAEPPAVQVEPGQLPEYEAEPAPVEVQPDTQRVVVPEVEVEPEGGQPQPRQPQPQPQPQR